MYLSIYTYAYIDFVETIVVNLPYFFHDVCYIDTFFIHMKDVT